MVVAHRGASVEQPENTIEAFEAAIDAGADAVEFDVRMTADGVAVVMHDPDVSRTTDGTGLVPELTLADIRRLQIPLPDGGMTGVPSLEEALTCLAGRAAADIEIKNLPGEPGYTSDREAAVEATLESLDELGFVSPVIVSSFNPRSVAYCRRLRPDVPTGLLTSYDVDADEALSRASADEHRWVLPFVTNVLDAGDGLADRVHAASALLGVWIADDPETARRLFELGADAVATNDPRAILPVRDDISPKRRFLVANSYGTGAVWASVLAHSAETIVARYPSLVLVDEPPSWLDAERLQRLEERMTIDIDDDEHPFFKAATS
jgi:glycerophosphoryl diester phosphodiesterase